MFGQQNPFGLGPRGSSQQPNPRPGVPETTSLNSSGQAQGPFGQTANSPMAFGQSASFATPTGISPFGTGSPNSTNAPIFGSTFRSPAMPTSNLTASSPPSFSTTTSAMPSFSSTASASPSFSLTTSAPPSFSSTASAPPSFSSTVSAPPSFSSTTSAPPSFSSTASSLQSFSFATNTSLQRGRTMPGFAPVPWTATSPIFPAGASNSPVFPVRKPLMSGDVDSGKLFGPRFSQSAQSANIFGQASTTPAMPTAAEPQSALLAMHDSTAEPEGAVMKSVANSGSPSKGRDGIKTDELRSEPARKVTVQRKVPLFTRALAGVGRMEKTGRTRLPSREEKPRDAHSRKSRERRNSVTDPDNLEKTLVTPKELQKLTSFMCKGVPVHLNNKQTLMQHFGKFGILTRLYCNTAKNSAYVYFRDHDAAANAKASGTVIEPGTEPMLILWTKSSSSGRQKSDAQSPIAESAKAAKPYVDPSDVNDELASMSQIQDFEPPRLLHRPKNSPKQRQTKPSPGEASETQQQEVSRSNVNSSEERYRVLDNRDKLLRQGVKKQSDLATAKATVGTCPDMCPEKERYMREHRNQLHPFEIKSDSDGRNPAADHRKVIKEYSRSSADQEEPLPHELRPANVLSMTMGYLVCNIMDRHEQGQCSAEEWFDFVWNRTRAIRKDITQQHLCDHVAVALVEKCARFHIHCASRLCEEDMSSFDQKINNENLTNCLQTLKYFYEDMEAKGERCAAEAEFRAYEVLLKLNEGDIQRQVQLLVPEVRESSQVTQALGFYAALNTNNYVRFFKLVRATSYLNACILQRYFTQVRLKALYAIVRAYSPITHSGQFPVSKLVEILAFEDQREACDFVEHYGLATDNTNVILDRSAISHPENPVALHRSMKIIESKRQCLVGEVINDGPLPPNPLEYHVPYSSFGDQGSLNRDSGETAKLHEIPQQSTGAITESQDQANDLVAAKYAEEQRAMILHEVSLAIMGSIIEDVVVDAIMRARADVLRLHEMERRFTLETCSAIMQAVCPQLIKQIAEQTLATEKSEELKARKRREEAELARQEYIRQFNTEYSEKVWEAVLLDVIKTQMQELATRELSTALEAARQQRIERSCNQLSNEYWEDHVNNSLHRICNGIYTELMEFRKKTLGRVADKLGVWRSAAAFRKWRNFVARRKRTRRSMETFPSCNLQAMSKPIVADKSLRVESLLQIAQDRKYLDRVLDVGRLNCSLRESFSHMWIDVISVAKMHVPYARELYKKRTSLQNLYWSIMFSFPLLAEDATGQLLSLVNWFKAKFAQPGSHPGSYATDADVLNTVIYDDGRSFTMPFTTAVCVKGVQGCLSDSKASASLLRGTQALLFILQTPKSENAHNSQKYWAEELERLTTVLRARPKNPAIPLLIIALGPMDPKIAIEAMRVDDLLTSNQISAVSVVTFSIGLSEPSSTQALTSSLQWAAQHCPSPPNLRIETFKEFINKVVTKFYSSLVYKDRARNGDVGRRHQPPDVLINAYNNAVEHGIATVSDKELMDVSWPQEEFAGKKLDLPKPNWNTETTLQERKHKASFYLLPAFCIMPKSSPGTDWIGLLRITLNYVKHMQDAHWGSKMALSSRIQAIFQESKARTQTNKAWMHEGVAWTEVVEVLIDHSLQMPLDMQVVYDLDKMEAFTESEEWQQAKLWSPKPVPQLIPLPLMSLAVKRKPEPVNDSSVKRKLFKDPFQSPNKSEGLQQSYSELKRQLSIEKEKTKQYEAYLGLVLQGGHTVNF